MRQNLQQNRVEGCAVKAQGTLNDSRPYDVVTDNEFLFRRAQAERGRLRIPSSKGNGLFVSSRENGPKLIHSTNIHQDIPSSVVLPNTVHEIRKAVGLPPIMYLSSAPQDPHSNLQDLQTSKRIAAVVGAVLQLVNLAFLNVPDSELRKIAKRDEILHFGVPFPVETMDQIIAEGMAVSKIP